VTEINSFDMFVTFLFVISVAFSAAARYANQQPAIFKKYLEHGKNICE